jgi:hypothetical protein
LSSPWRTLIAQKHGGPGLYSAWPARIARRNGQIQAAQISKQVLKGTKNRVTNDRLFDEAGQEWKLVRNDLSREEIVHLLAEQAVKVGVHQNYGDPLRWVTAELRWQVWRSEIESEFFG